MVFLALMIFTGQARCISTNQGQVQSGDQDIRSFDIDFKDRYKSGKYNYEGDEIYGGSSKSNGEDVAYDNKEPKNNEDNNTSAIQINGLFLYLAIIILVLALAYLVYILLNEGRGGLFSSKGSKKLIDENNIDSENLEHVDFKNLILDAEDRKNYRLAIRYSYLSVLKELMQHGIIDYQDEKTNEEYQQEIKDKVLHSKFSYISYLYNYIWYGEFQVDQPEYIQAKNNFENLLQKII